MKKLLGVRKKQLGPAQRGGVQMYLSLVVRTYYTRFPG
jgi:hypothetical protein